MTLFAFLLPSMCAVLKFGGDFQLNLVIPGVRAMPLGCVNRIQFQACWGLVWPWVRSCHLVARSFLKACLAFLPFSTLFYNGMPQSRQFSSQTSLWSYLRSACKSDQWPLLNVISSRIGLCTFLSVTPCMKEIERCRRSYCARLVKNRRLICILAFGHQTLMTPDFRSKFDLAISASTNTCLMCLTAKSRVVFELLL